MMDQIRRKEGKQELQQIPPTIDHMHTTMYVYVWSTEPPLTGLTH